MSLTTEGKLELIQAERSRLEHELFACDVALQTAEAAAKASGGTGLGEGDVEAKQAAYDRVKAQVDKLDEMAKDIKSGADED